MAIITTLQAILSPTTMHPYHGRPQQTFHQHLSTTALQRFGIDDYEHVIVQQKPLLTAHTISVNLPISIALLLHCQ